MNRRLPVAVVGIILVAFGVLSAHAQDLKAMLLKPASGWVMEWSNPDTGNRGVTEAVFADRGGKVVASLTITETGTNTGGPLSCEQDVTIAADTIHFHGCRDRDYVLVFDPSDTAYPLKSKNRSANGDVLKAKAK